MPRERIYADNAEKQREKRARATAKRIAERQKREGDDAALAWRARQLHRAIELASNVDSHARAVLRPTPEGTLIELYNQFMIDAGYSRKELGLA